MSDLYDRIKEFEGYYRKPYWDYKQWSVGHGTRASGPNDIVDEAEARRRLITEVDHARGYVDKVGQHLDPGTRDALTSFVYNVGPQAVTGETGLADAVRSGDPERIRERLLQYNKAGGKTLPGLVERRQQEASWIGRDVPSPEQPNIPNILASGYGRESGGAMPAMPDPSYASAAPPAASAPTEQAWLSKALGLSPSMDKGLSNIASVAGAFGKSQEGGGDDQQLAALRNQVAQNANAALSEDEQRAQAALKTVLSRRQRSAFG